MGSCCSFFRFGSYNINANDDNADNSVMNAKKEMDAIVTNIKSHKTTPTTSKEVLDTKSSELVLPDLNNKPLEKLNQDNKSTVEKDKALSHSNIEEAVIKIQAGIRGYLTRKHLSETLNKNSESTVINEANNSNILKETKQVLSHIISDTFGVENTEVDKNELEKKENNLDAVNFVKKEILDETSNQILNEKESSEKFLDGKVFEKVVTIIQDSVETDASNSNSKYLNLPKTDQSLIDKAATKIQAVFRGYQVRKSILRGVLPSKVDESQHVKENVEEIETPKVESDLKTNDTIEKMNEKKSLDALNKLDQELSKELNSNDKETFSLTKCTTSENDFKENDKSSVNSNQSSENTQTCFKTNDNMDDIKITTSNNEVENLLQNTVAEKKNFSDINETLQDSSNLVNDQISQSSDLPNLNSESQVLENLEKPLKNGLEEFIESKETIGEKFQEICENQFEKTVEQKNKDINEVLDNINTSSLEKIDLDSSNIPNTSLIQSTVEKVENEAKPPADSA